jgi:predicted  nucleic acid-binding Zn-ribbon protein
VADEPKPAEEPVVVADSSAPDAEPHDGRPRAPAADAIPDAEVIEEPETDRTPPPRREPEPQPVRAEPPPPPRRSGAFLGFVLGGAIAAAGGFALARYQPDLLPAGVSSAVTAQFEQQAATLSDLRQQVEALAARETPDISAELANLGDEIRGEIRGELDARIAALPPAPDVAALAEEARKGAEGALAGIEARLSELEQRPAVDRTAMASAVTASTAASGTTGTVGIDDSVLAAYDQQLQALKAELESQRGTATGASDELKALAEQAQSQLAAATAEAAKLKADAEAVGQAALARAALSRIKAALDSGEPYSGAVAELTEAGQEVPEVLAASAEAGIPSLTELQQSFPDAARAALDAALRADMGETWPERAAAFLRTQTGARSLTPREGQDPDAVLSRAEAALHEGQVAAALAELATLPEAARAPLAGWIASAEQREAASAAVAALSTALDAE